MNDRTNIAVKFFFHPRLAWKFGPTAGIMASYLIAKGGDSYEVEATYATIAGDTGLSENNIETAKAKLVEAGALLVRSNRLEHRTFYSINMAEICHLL